MSGAPKASNSNAIISSLRAAGGWGNGDKMHSLPSEGAKVVARAMQKYGMYHADGGNIALTAQSDRHTTAKWDGLLDPQDLAALKVEDFEVIDHGAMITLTQDCMR